MKIGISRRALILVGVIVLLGSASTASAAGTALSTTTTPLGNIVVNGQGMTAYFYELDKANSGVSACKGGCAKNWSAIISRSLKFNVSGVQGKITLLPHTRQMAINGRPIYTFIGDRAKGATNGQGLGGVWFVIAADGSELKNVNASTPAATNTPTPSNSPTPTASAAPITPTPSSTPTVSSTAGTYSNSNY